MFHQILVALDLEKTSQTVFRQAMEMAKAMNARLMLLHVLNEDQGMPPLESMASVGYYPGSLSLEGAKQYQQSWQRYIDQSLEQLRVCAQQAEKAGVMVEFTQTTGRTGRMICDQARNWNADLIIVGRRGQSALSELLLGSVSNYVTHHASCAVMVVQSSKTSQDTAQVETNDQQAKALVS
ncbi:MAG: universal stress protein [Microcoleaceae cyanobacterium]